MLKYVIPEVRAFATAGRAPKPLEAGSKAIRITRAHQLFILIDEVHVAWLTYIAKHLLCNSLLSARTLEHTLSQVPYLESNSVSLESMRLECASMSKNAKFNSHLGNAIVLEQNCDYCQRVTANCWLHVIYLPSNAE